MRLTVADFDSLPIVKNMCSGRNDDLHQTLRFLHEPFILVQFSPLIIVHSQWTLLSSGEIEFDNLSSEKSHISLRI